MNKLEKELATKDIIEILSEFDLRHVPYMDDGTYELNGMVVKDRKLILISDSNLRSGRYSTIIHELLHAKDILFNDDSSERFMKTRTDRAYQQIFNRKYLQTYSRLNTTDKS